MERKTVLFIAIWAIAVMGYTCNVPPSRHDNDTLPPHVVDADEEIVGSILTGWDPGLGCGGGWYTYTPLLYLSEEDRYVVLKNDMSDFPPLFELWYESADCTGAVYMPSSFRCDTGPNVAIAYPDRDRLWAADGQQLQIQPASFSSDGVCSEASQAYSDFPAFEMEDITPADWPPALPMRLVMPAL